MRLHSVILPDRGVLRLSGPDRAKFLQALISADIDRLARDAALYASLLTPQGRFLHDMFIVQDGDDYLLDVAVPRAADLIRRLTLYRLRSQVVLADESPSWRVAVLFGQPDARPPIMLEGKLYADPRLAALGWRAMLPVAKADALLAGLGVSPGSARDYHRLRIAQGVPDTLLDLVPEKSLLLENNIDTLGGIDWQKGCYIGQELTARMRYRGLLKKRLLPFIIGGPVPPPDSVLLTASGQEAAVMRGAVGDHGLAVLRLDFLMAAQGEGLRWNQSTLRAVIDDDLTRRLGLMETDGGSS